MLLHFPIVLMTPLLHADLKICSSNSVLGWFHTNSLGALQLTFMHMITNYNACKDKLLTRLGDTLTNADHQCYNLTIQPGENWDSLATHIVLIGMRMLSNCTTVEKVLSSLYLYQTFISLCRRDCCEG